MQILNDNDITYKDCSKLREILKKHDIDMNPPKGGGSYDDCVIAYVLPKGITSESEKVRVIIWPYQQGENAIICFRVILIANTSLLKGNHERFPSDKLREIVNEITSDDQNFDFFGHIALENINGVTLEYCLDTTGGVLAHTIVNAARSVALGAISFKRTIEGYF